MKLMLPDLNDIDLSDPVTANAIADAIVRFKGGGYVPLSQRYPWEFPERRPGLTLSDAEVELVELAVRRYILHPATDPEDEWFALADRLSAERDDAARRRK